MNTRALLKKFDNPGAAWRGKPFWAWNGKLDRKELLRQVHVMKQMGFGGFFMHSRTGLATEYLGDEWFDLINACADEAEKTGLEAWLYDEDRWPSGLAGGLVTQHPEYRALALQMDRLPLADLARARKTKRLAAIFLADVEGLAARNAERLLPGMRPAKTESRSLLVFHVVETERSSFYNGYTYVDNLNRKAADCFIRLTHEEYRKHCGNRLGRSIKGIFTDEPHRGRLMVGSDTNPARRRQAPWTGELPKRFRKDFGYDIVDHLPEIYLRKDGRAVSQVKWHFVECLQRMFLDNFAKPYANWCRRHKLLVTGHILHENSLAAQTAMSGSMMRYYAHMDYPGVDVLGRETGCYWIVKQLSSAARQLGRARLLSELYGCTGWDMPFADHKAVGDWQALFGINLRCHHLAWYTMEGQAKRDYPGSFIHHSTWWRRYDIVERYFARIGLLLNAGRPACNVLVLNPIESVWCQIHEGWAHWLDSDTDWNRWLMHGYKDLFLWLSGAQIDFDYGDEDMIARLASVPRGTRMPLLRVGKAAYRMVIVPRMITLRASTLALLKKFRAAGGAVLFANEAPPHVDAIPSRAARDFAALCGNLSSFKREALVSAVDGVLSGFDVRVTEDGGQPAVKVFAQMRRAKNFDVVMLLNTDGARGLTRATVQLQTTGSVEEWDCLTGERRSVPARAMKGIVEFTEDFAAAGAHVYIVRRENNLRPPMRRQLKTVSRSARKGPFAYRLDEPNVCVLDWVQYRIGNGPWSPAMEILKADEAVRKKLGIELRGGEMLQPWWVNRQNVGKPDGKARVAFRYSFEIAALPPAPVELVVENPAAWTIRCNGMELNPASATGWWVDIALQRLALPPAALRPGRNVVEVETNFHYNTNPEAMFILGAFGVRLRGERKRIDVLPARLRIGDVTRQGFPFYSGSIFYELPIEGRPSNTGFRSFFCLPAFGGTCAAISANGAEARTMPWHPFETDITDLLKRGVTKLELEIVTSRRNSFGPLHQFPAQNTAGPPSFLTRGKFFRNAYVLVPNGLLAPPVLEKRTANP